jgi:hypothetical protein
MATDHDAPPYLSIVVTGRNDGYGGDFVARFFATLEFNDRELAARGVPYELVLVEWAPVRGVRLLADLVDDRCSASAAAACRAVIVDPAYHEAMTLNPRLVYHEFLAKNVGVRHSRGAYVLTTNCDVVLGRHILRRLERRDFEPGVVYRAARWDLVGTLDVARLDWATLEDPASLARPAKTLRPPYFRGSAGDFIALDCATFHRLGGFNEVYRAARFGIDANFLIHAVSSGVAIADVGGPVYHVDHGGSYQAARTQFAGREADAHYGDERWPYNEVVYRNRPTWGLSEAPARVAGPRRTYLDFSWAAVPPLVDLAGVVLPARRGAAAGDPTRLSR